MTKAPWKGSCQLGRDVVKGPMQRAILDANMVWIVEESCRKYPFPQSLTGLANTTDFLCLQSLEITLSYLRETCVNASRYRL